MIKHFRFPNSLALYRDTVLILELPMTSSKKRAAETERKRVISDLQDIINTLVKGLSLRIALQTHEVPLPTLHILSEKQGDGEEKNAHKRILSDHAVWAVEQLAGIV